MRNLPWFIAFVVVAVYVVLISVFEFEGPIALAIHFARTSIIMAILILYIPALREIFSMVPAPSRDYLLAGIILTELSNECFSIWNEMGRIYKVDTSIFTSPVAGFFSLLLAVGGISLLKAADETEYESRWLLALIIAVVFSTLLVFVAPQFR